MNYLIYVEHAAENLQFFLWYRGYIKRFETLNHKDKVLSPEWTANDQKDAWEDWQKSRAKVHKRQVSTAVTELLKGTPFSEDHAVSFSAVGASNPFVTPPPTSHQNNSSEIVNSSQSQVAVSMPWDSATTAASPGGASLQTNGSDPSNTSRETAYTVAREAFANVGLSQPCMCLLSPTLNHETHQPPVTIQPYRQEMDRIIKSYIADNAPRQLNISSRQRRTILKALEATTHPSAFQHVAQEIENTLRQQLHPNFIRWSIYNGNRPRVIFACVLGIITILLGVLLELLLTLSRLSRGYRAFGAIPLFIGVATFNAAARGMCVVLHGFHHRHLRQWELFSDEEEEEGQNNKNSKEDAASTDSHHMRLRESVESTLSSNSYEDHPWIARYKKRNLIRKVFDREVWVQEPALRQIQDMVFLQSLLVAFVSAGILTAIFVAVPDGNFF